MFSVFLKSDFSVQPLCRCGCCIEQFLNHRGTEDTEIAQRRTQMLHEKTYLNLLPAAEVQAQRRIRQMRVIVLRPWTYYRAFVVIVVLIANVPIKPVVQLDGQPRFGRLKTHGI